MYINVNKYKLNTKETKKTTINYVTHFIYHRKDKSILVLSDNIHYYYTVMASDSALFNIHYYYTVMASDSALFEPLQNSSLTLAATFT